MARDLTTSMQDDLQQFVLQTQDRLEGLLRSLHNLQETAKGSAQAAVPLADEASFSAADGPANEQNEFESTEILQTLPSPAINPKVPEETLRDAAKHERPAAVDASDATDRLAAIKRRLAEQIKNP